LAKPREVSNHTTGEVERVVLVIRGEMKRVEIQSALGLRHEDCIAMTIPDKPKSSRQKYRLTDKGIALQANLLKGNK